ncbi:TlpA family protein disulfide reductase [Subsaximicrobium wynnwilliamsii]|uniref:TlpA family protein disulfide reductase n=1 Tax=Subsaximicrobium wynnwilliamsii TaxID=291179 RepID=A0A5C6ZN00_9FLAO|nr:TlpA disulfide reductase family protein [Subsaximicrobium wynnwilliamsii]TXD85467.1 TlpA family protein disulfide reductase [Subsaximicrobium wynnwilliamsii]TXD90820.1 TlpA family protein disulfide reductase [Subsaximicrobium wynnwilliamsii]TXE05327.1 TlpA family protein disulfide reductase [Subsaximicrobium wynnwilliamsii]
MKKLTLILALFSLLRLSAQDKEIIYRQADGKLMTESQYLKMKNNFKDKMKKQGKTGEVKEEIKDSIAHQTTYKNFKLFFVEITETTKKERIDTYIDKKFPSNELLTLESEKFSFSGLEGKPTFISFWFIQCAPCIKELPALIELKKKYGDRVNFVAITFNDAKEVESFLEKREFDYKHIVNADDFINDIGLNTYPRNIFMDKNGTIRAIKNEIPYEEKTKNKKVELEFDLSEFEKQLENLL